MKLQASERTKCCQDELEHLWPNKTRSVSSPLRRWQNELRRLTRNDVGEKNGERKKNLVRHSLSLNREDNSITKSLTHLLFLRLVLECKKMFCKHGKASQHVTVAYCRRHGARMPSHYATDTSLAFDTFFLVRADNVVNAGKNFSVSEGTQHSDRSSVVRLRGPQDITRNIKSQKKTSSPLIGSHISPMNTRIKFLASWGQLYLTGFILWTFIEPLSQRIPVFTLLKSTSDPGDHFEAELWVHETISNWKLLLAVRLFQND